MIFSIIRHFTLCICDIYIFNKIINYRESTLLKRFLYIAFSLIVSFLVVKLEPYLLQTRIILMIVLSGTFMSFFTDKKLNLSIVTMFISYGISYAFSLIASVTITIIKHLVGIESNSILIVIFTCALQFVLCVVLFKIRRLQNGFSFMNKPKAATIGLIISIVILIYTFIRDRVYNNTTAATILMICVIICVLSILYWWRQSLTKQYRDSLINKESEHLNKTIQEKDNKIQKLTRTNEFLSSIVHQDNHIIPAMKLSIQNLMDTLVKTTSDPAAVQEIKDLLEQLESLTAERTEAMVREQNSNKILPTTKIALIDGVFLFLLTKALKEKIELDLSVTGSIRYMIDNVISQTSLETLISDHVKDAIIAVKAGDNPDRRIFIHLGIVDKCYELSIKDTGIPFEIDTLMNLGRKRITTHSGTGGSGIGFMTTFTTMKDTGASLIISEHAPKQASFSKTVCIRFDGRNEYTIQSYRYKEIQAACDREDIIIQKL